MKEERNRFDKHRAFLKFKVENINDSFYSDTLNYISKLESFEVQVVKLIDAIEKVQDISSVDELNLLSNETTSVMVAVIRLKNSIKDFMGVITEKELYCPTCDNYDRCVEDYKEASGCCDYYIPKEGIRD